MDTPYRYDGSMSLTGAITYAQHEYCEKFGKWPTYARLPNFRRAELYADLKGAISVVTIGGLWEEFNGLKIEWWHKDFIELE